MRQGELKLGCSDKFDNATAMDQNNEEENQPYTDVSKKDGNPDKAEV